MSLAPRPSIVTTPYGKFYSKQPHGRMPEPGLDNYPSWTGNSVFATEFHAVRRIPPVDGRSPSAALLGIQPEPTAPARPPLRCALRDAATGCLQWAARRSAVPLRSTPRDRAHRMARASSLTTPSLLFPPILPRPERPLGRVPFPPPAAAWSGRCPDLGGPLPVPSRLPPTPPDSPRSTPSGRPLGPRPLGTCGPPQILAMTLAAEGARARRRASCSVVIKPAM